LGEHERKTTIEVSNMARIRDYEKQVYAGVLGKVVGVYMGRPFEGWNKDRLEARWGKIDRYVHEDQNVPLVVSDDDISGTLTFIRALEDSGLYENTPDEFFGETWLNYLIERKTVLWWGGMGHSTEHTAYLRLKHGIKAPLSGAIETNGRIVAEQIGAQIFIDAFGLVAPGKPELAATLARRSGSVSHDGESVHAAVVVAGMISAAFVEKDMKRLLDIGIGLIPENSLIARVHRDVRQWCARDRDWRKTYQRIDRKYGYSKYGGNCHIIPNHAIMVMAWCYAPDDFHEAQVIINTAGWDTDCNAANVGSLMGVKVGLDRINEKYEFQKPFADRILLPTAEGTRGTTDVLTEALRIARIGRKVMGWKSFDAPKKGAWHHFEMPGALHGYLGEDSTFETRGAASVENVSGHSEQGGRSMRIAYDVSTGRVARVSTPVLPTPRKGGYALAGSPRLYAGMKVTLRGVAGSVDGQARARVFVRYAKKLHDTSEEVVRSRSVRIASNKRFALSLVLPDTEGNPVQDFGIEVDSDVRSSGEIFVDSVAFSGTPVLRYPAHLDRIDGEIPGWVMDADMTRGPFSDDKEVVTHVGKNESRGVLVTGTTDWRDYTLSARVKIHMADRGGILVRYQGLRRYIALVKTPDKLQLVMHYYGDTVLDEVRCRWKVDDLHKVRLTCKGKQIEAWCDGKKVLSGTDDKLGRGGAGFVFEKGIIGFRDVRID
jgi:ADP-ribosylglycohydrolase